MKHPTNIIKNNHVGHKQESPKTTVYHYTVFFFVIIAFGFRICTLPNNFETNRPDIGADYLRARHVLLYHQMATGQKNMIFPTLPNTPVYDLVLAGLIFIHDSVYTLAIVNIIGQLITILSLYAISLLLFDQYTAFTVGIMTLFSQQWIMNAYIPWQPAYTEPLFATSYLAVTLGYKKRKPIWFALAGGLYAATLIPGYYGIIGFPTFLLLVWAVQRYVGLSLKARVVSFVVPVCLAMLWYLPVFWHTANTSPGILFPATSFVRSFPLYINQLGNNFALLVQGFAAPNRFPSVYTLVMITFGLDSSGFSKRRRKSNVCLPSSSCYLYSQSSFLLHCFP